VVMKKCLLALAGALLLTAAQAEDKVPPDLVVKRTTSELKDLIAANHEAYRADLPGFYKVVDSVVVPHFDVPFIAKIVLARNWRTATEEQKQRFQKAFTSMLIRSYANAMLAYYDMVKAEWKPLHMAPDTDDVTVNSSILRQGREPVNVGFSMHLVGSDWKIYDITVENVSLATNFRAQLVAEIKRTSLDTVIERMETGNLSPAPVQATAGGSATSRTPHGIERRAHRRHHPAAAGPGRRARRQRHARPVRGHQRRQRRRRPAAGADAPRPPPGPGAGLRRRGRAGQATRRLF
jgi:phospholipid transport system substrate-binding protein